MGLSTVFVSDFSFSSTKSIFARISDVEESIGVRVELVEFTRHRRHHRADVLVHDDENGFSFIELKYLTILSF